jgi:hypothetical protein
MNNQIKEQTLHPSFAGGFLPFFLLEPLITILIASSKIGLSPS